MNRSALDFRHFVDHLRRQGDLVDVHTEVDANLEIGAITRRVYERRAPAPLFHNIRDSLPLSLIHISSRRTEHCQGLSVSWHEPTGLLQAQSSC